MQNAATFFALAFAFLLCAFRYTGLAIPLGWTAFSFGWVALGYACLGPSAFGKRRDGVIPPTRRLLLFPYLLFTWVTWHAYRCLTREAPFHQVNERLLVGRRLLSTEAPAELESYVDLTAELQDPGRLRRLPQYGSFPILDASAPSPVALRALLDWLGAGRAFIHCAQGHGRTGVVAAAVLLERGEAEGLDDALEKLRTVRPGIRLNREQRRFLTAFIESSRS